MSLHRFPVLGLLGASFVLWLAASCNSDDDKCVTGETRICTCAGSSRPRGAQECQADNTFGACDCSGQGIVEPDEDGEQVFRVLVGRPCKQDPDCGEGLLCITAESNDFGGFGGVAGGYCSKGCNTATPEDCTAVDSNSDCLGFDEGGNGFCFRTCQTGNPGANEQKCLDRPDLVCASEAALFGEGVQAGRNPGWCFPHCNSDAECPGRICSPRSLDGLCRDEVPEALPIGSRCEADAECESNLCLAFDAEGNDRACSQQCVYQGIAFSPAACGYSGSPREAGCLFPQFTSALGREGIGDFGLCLELCDVDSDCTQADTGWFCNLNNNIETFAQRPGYCLPASARPADPDAGDAGPVEAGVGVDVDASVIGDAG